MYQEYEQQGLDMKRPCNLCPFRSDENSIRFADEERAMEIVMSALFHGFPCHKTADYAEGEEGQGGYVFGQASQHCAGFLIMRLKEDSRNPWPAINVDSEIISRLRESLDLNSPVFPSIKEFLQANRDGPVRRRRRTTSQ